MKNAEKYFITEANNRFLDMYITNRKFKEMKSIELILVLLEDTRLNFSSYYDIAAYVNAIKGTSHDHSSISRLMSSKDMCWTKKDNRYILNPDYYSSYTMYDSPFITIFKANEETLEQIAERLLEEYGDNILDMQYGIKGNLIVYSTIYALSTKFDIDVKGYDNPM